MPGIADHNLSPHQQSVQRLVDQFNADERQWQKARKEVLQALRNIKKRQRKTDDTRYGLSRLRRGRHEHTSITAL